MIKEIYKITGFIADLCTIILSKTLVTNECLININGKYMLKYLTDVNPIYFTIFETVFVIISGAYLFKIIKKETDLCSYDFVVISTFVTCYFIANFLRQLSILSSISLTLFNLVILFFAFLFFLKLCKLHFKIHFQ